MRNRHPRDIHSFEPVLACAGVRSASDTADDESTPDGSDGVAVHAGTVASDYAADYYGHYAVDGVAYERNDSGSTSSARSPTA